MRKLALLCNWHITVLLVLSDKSGPGLHGQLLHDFTTKYAYVSPSRGKDDLLLAPIPVSGLVLLVKRPEN